MKRTSISVRNTIKGEYSYKTSARGSIEEPSVLPDGCEECGAYKGSSFEIRLLYLIGFYDLEFNKERFLCEKCFLQARTKEDGRPEEIITRKNSIIVSHIFDEEWHEYFLNEPCLPDGCEECGAYKGSSFEKRIMNLLCLNGQQDGQFLCEDCFVKIKPEDLDRQLVD
jgi:hypothetical protein